MSAKNKRRVLFLCTGNAARSQMAEGLARAFHGDELEVVSAGSRPAGWIHPSAIRAMNAIGIDITEQHSKSADEFLHQTFDAVVTVCDSAAQDCPTWPGARRIEHWSIEDPSSNGYEAFVATGDDLARGIDALASEIADGVGNENA